MSRRLSMFDALKGFAILMVVYTHVLQYVGIGYYYYVVPATNFLTPFLSVWQPAFFYRGYIIGHSWHPSSGWDICGKKSGTVVSISLFTWLYKNKRTGLPLLERLGQYTLEIYALHFILIHLALYHHITIPYTSLIYELLYCPAIIVMILVWCDYAYWSSIGTKQQSYCSLENRAWEAGYPENAWCYNEFRMHICPYFY